MVYNPMQSLPTAEDLPETDHKPVDSQLQILIASLLDDILSWVWRNRNSWFWGINMGIYYNPQKSPIVPDGFLRMGVERLPRAGGRLSYVVWQEAGVVPLLAVEYVSKTYGGEYDTKKDDYAAISVKYYVVYNPEYCNLYNRSPFTVYLLVKGTYILQSSEPFWIAEAGLSIGRGQRTYRNWNREWLYWYDEQGNQLPALKEVVQQERQRTEQAQQQLEQEQRLREELLAKLLERGIDLDV